MVQVHDAIARLAQVDSVPVLIQGETGTGKELVAQALHEKSLRAAGPFVAVNCAAIPEHLLESELFGYEKGAFTDAKSAHRGKIEQASGGTLLLDEIGDMRLDLQAKLLRVLQTKKVERLGAEQTLSLDIRVLCTTNTSLRRRAERGGFRFDLFWRISVAMINIPPLRNRPEDVLILFEHFLELYGKKFEKEPIPEVSPAAWEKLSEHSFAGNVRELENVSQRALLYHCGSGPIGPDHIVLDQISPRAIASFEVPYGLSLDEVMRKYILLVLDELGGNRKKAARFLRMSSRTLYQKLRQYREQGFLKE